MDSIKKLTELFAKFPTVGPRTAGRFVFYLINQPKEIAEELIWAIQELKNNITLCAFCFNPHESGNNLCAICFDATRHGQVLCIVEKENDLISIERTGRYKGLYFILEGQEPARIKSLKERMQNPEAFGMPRIIFSEIIIATNPTPEGKTISALIVQMLKELPNFTALKITHLAKGLPVGGELEYADEETLESALEGRK